ncbi:transcriptional regulator [Amylibacter sp. IMCC11727]|uniref:MarR family winged helix-turn-helix transcriptional regulator n=1 Tax=Amylibacter sp. IMCC11727 TaxID=3039851 RepID=UPI00244E0FF1|nr:transcriptional regulator [Amylibacter sp. IMCC11727]WGI22014.1 transcriptional regulator [Amylibacter sp. IMCC11727]
MTDQSDSNLAVALFSELIAADQAIKGVLSRRLPKGMEMSHFSVLTHLNHVTETSPAKLARSFALTKGAITNTLKKLELAGYIHIRPDWDDARKKQVSISAAGRAAHEQALLSLMPEFEKVAQSLGDQKIKAILPTLRQFRGTLKS